MTVQRSPAHDLQLRAAQPADALCLSVLGMQVFLDTYATEGIRPAVAREVLATFSVAAFEQALSAPDTHIEVAEANGHLVGFAQISFGARHALAPPGLPAELLRLYVQEPFTGAQLGTRLLRRAEQLAAQRGCTVLWLTPWAYNHRALVFYARRGYTDHGLTEFVFEGESHPNRVVARAIERAVEQEAEQEAQPEVEQPLDRPSSAPADGEARR